MAALAVLCTALAGLLAAATGAFIAFVGWLKARRSNEIPQVTLDADLLTWYADEVRRLNEELAHCRHTGGE